MIFIKIGLGLLRFTFLGLRLSKQRSETLVFRCFLCCQHSQRSGDQALGPNGSELAGAASDLSRSPRLTESANNFTLFFLNQSRARVGRRSSVVGRRSSIVGPRDGGCCCSSACAVGGNPRQMASVFSSQHHSANAQPQPACHGELLISMRRAASIC